MQVAFDCPKCRTSDVAEVRSSTSMLACRHCGWEHRIDASGMQAEAPDHCLVCECRDLWRRKAVSPQWRLTFAIVGVLASGATLVAGQPAVALGLLMLMALIDWMVVLALREVLTCYRCRACYRRTGPLHRFPGFDARRNEQYRRESAPSTQSSSATSPTS